MPNNTRQSLSDKTSDFERGSFVVGKNPLAEWLAGLKATAKHPQVYLKVSALVESAMID